MGIPLSILNKIGFSGLNYADKFYDQYFNKKDMTSFQAFHIAFIEVCKDINSILPGKHYDLPPRKEIEVFFNKWEKLEDEKKKKELIDFITDKVQESKSGGAMVITGLIAPAAAVVLKRSAETMPQVKKFRLHLVPNFAFVPSFTLLSLMGVRIIQTYQKAKSFS